MVLTHLHAFTDAMQRKDLEAMLTHMTDDVARTATSLAWPATFLGAVGLWFWLAHGEGVAVLLGAPALALTAVLGVVWRSRARATRRFRAAVEAHAEREIDRERRRRGRRRVPGASTPVRALASGSTHGR
jgi:hypothetical protein